MVLVSSSSTNTDSLGIVNFNYIWTVRRDLSFLRAVLSLFLEFSESIRLLCLPLVISAYFFSSSLCLLPLFFTAHLHNVKSFAKLCLQWDNWAQPLKFYPSGCQKNLAEDIKL